MWFRASGASGSYGDYKIYLTSDNFLIPDNKDNFWSIYDFSNYQTHTTLSLLPVSKRYYDQKALLHYTFKGIQHAVPLEIVNANIKYFAAWSLDGLAYLHWFDSDPIEDMWIEWI